MQEPVAGQANIQHAHRTCTKQQQQQKCSTTSHIHVCIVRRSLHVQRITAMCDRMWLETQIGNSPFVWFTHKLCTITRRYHVPKAVFYGDVDPWLTHKTKFNFGSLFFRLFFSDIFIAHQKIIFDSVRVISWTSDESNWRALAYHSFWWPFDGIRMNMIDKEA